MEKVGGETVLRSKGKWAPSVRTKMASVKVHTNTFKWGASDHRGMRNLIEEHLETSIVRAFKSTMSSLKLSFRGQQNLHKQQLEIITK